MTDASPVLFARQHITAQPRPDGSVLLSAAGPLGEYPATIVHSLRAWAAAGPDQLLAAERPGSSPAAPGSSPAAAGPGWRTCSYGEAVAAADAIGQALLERGLGPGRPLLVLSGNSIDHLLVMLGAMTAGVPAAPVSVAYSLQSRDHRRVRDIAAMASPGAVFAADGERFGPALDALDGVPAITSSGHRDGAVRLGELTAAAPGRLVADAFGV